MNGRQKKAEVAILISDKLDLKPKTLIRDEEGYYIIIKVSIQQALTIVPIYGPNMEAANYINQLITKLKKHIGNTTIIVGDFNTPLTEMDRSSKQKISKEIKALNDTLTRWTSQIYSEHSVPKQQNTHSSLLHMEHSPESHPRS